MHSLVIFCLRGSHLLEVGKGNNEGNIFMVYISFVNIICVCVCARAVSETKFLKMIRFMFYQEKCLASPHLTS